MKFKRTVFTMIVIVVLAANLANAADDGPLFHRNISKDDLEEVLLEEIERLR